ncbi:MAG TPA: hypothetical protein VF579_04120 [Candidatus Methylomirabilis sp.]
MLIDFSYETAITIDHEAGIMRVDTTLVGMATALLRAGFTETTDPRSRPYRRFRGAADQVRFRKPKAQRTLRGAARAAVEGRSMVGVAA